MGLIHSRAAKQRNKAEAKLLDQQRHQEQQAARSQRTADRKEQAGELVAAIEAGELTFADIPRTKRLLMDVRTLAAVKRADARYQREHPEQAAEAPPSWPRP